MTVYLSFRPHTVVKNDIQITVTVQMPIDQMCYKLSTVVTLNFHRNDKRQLLTRGTGPSSSENSATTTKSSMQALPANHGSATLKRGFSSFGKQANSLPSSEAAISSASTKNVEKFSYPTNIVMNQPTACKQQ